MTISEVINRVVGADPAAGVEVSYTVPAGSTLRLLVVTVSLVQGLTQTPQPTLVVDDGTNIIYQAPGSSDATGQAASTTARYTWAVGLPLTARVGTTPNIFAYAPLPDRLIVPATWRIRTVTAGIGANTDYGVPSLLVEDYGS